MLKALLAATLGQYGRQRVHGIPVGQFLALLSQIFGQAAADADELRYLDQQADATEGILEDVPASSIRSLYADLIGADNLELAKAAGVGNLEFAEVGGAGTVELAEAAGWEELGL